MNRLALAGVRIVVTRAAHQAEELANPLRVEGAEVILLPAIAIGPPGDSGPLHCAAARIDTYQWVVFTSTNSVAALLNVLPCSPGSIQASIAAVGSATASAARAAGFRVVWVPERYTADSLVGILPTGRINDVRVLIPKGDIARDTVSSELQARGAQVDSVEAYRNVVPADLARNAGEVFSGPTPHWVTFASPSAVHNLVSAVPPSALARSSIASIGPVTSAAVRSYNLQVAAQADPHTVAGLVNAIRTAAMP